MSENKNFSTNNFLSKLKNNKKIQLLLIVILLVLAFFLFFGDLFVNKNSNENNIVSDYVDNLEKKLTKTLSAVEGAGKVSVIITVKSGMETVLASETVIKETDSLRETTQTPLIINGKTVVLKELYPEISGVLIVAEGADKIVVMQKIQQAAMSLLDVNINQIEILTMK